MTRFAVALSVAALFAASPALAGDRGPTALPPAAREADLEENLGGRVDPALAFTDSTGRAVRLGDYLDGERPLLLVLAYYRCPMLCGLVLHGVVDGLHELDWALGDRYRVLTVSFDPRDQPDAAQKKQASVLKGLGRSDDAAALWPFLVGDERSTRALADSLGFRFGYDDRTDQYAHPAAIFALAPDGTISRYLYGVRFSARDLRLALLEASQGKTGTLVDRVLMTCYRYDPATRAYGPAIFGFMRLGAIAILLTVGAVLVVLWRGELRKRREERP